ncbi:MAG: AmmeMemoRadiSam system radical SAM enzyme [Planctomycetes bacterium]|nr:AmmeMemoRadiSam system radical SAM enzyme [Planctomycetota bacterium]
MKEALFYKKLESGKVQCVLCPHNCSIATGKTGICRQRKNVNGSLYTLIYGNATSVAMDPIEKKPLYHFFPGSQILSLGTNGCNFSCPFCQNWHISQENADTEPVSPEQAVALAENHHSVGIAYTYNEPFIWYEFVLKTARLASAHGLKNVLVSNGYVNPEPLRQLLPYIHALNIDLKSIDEVFYKRLCKAKLAPVLETCQTASKTALVEITNLIIPGENDSERNINDLSKWVSENLGRHTPVHFSAYHPDYQMDNPSTPAKSLESAYETARKYLDYVYVGNASVKTGNDTLCVKCGSTLIARKGYSITIQDMSKNGCCAKCGTDNHVIST